jgi:hypothetical protein
MGLRSFDELRPHMLRRRVEHGRIVSYAEVAERLEHRQLLLAPPSTWLADWQRADPDRFTP